MKITFNPIDWPENQPYTLGIGEFSRLEVSMLDVANTLKSADRFNETVQRLYGCTTIEQISETFDRYKIETPADKRELLHRCMEIEEYFDSSHEELSAEDEYDYAVSVFLEGSWRLMVNG